MANSTTVLGAKRRYEGNSSDSTINWWNTQYANIINKWLPRKGLEDFLGVQMWDNLNRDTQKLIRDLREQELFDADF